MSKLEITEQGDALIEELFELPYKLPHNDVGIGMPFPSRLVIEPRKVDGSLDVKRIGTDRLVKITDKIGTLNRLCDLYFVENKDAENARGQDIMDWLCDNGLVARARTW